MVLTSFQISAQYNFLLIGVVLLLFTIGIEFSLVQLASLRRLLFVAAPTIQVGGVAPIVSLAAMAVGLPWQQAIFWGFLLSWSSTAIVLKALAAASDSLHGRAAISILIFKNLAIVPMILLSLPILASPNQGALTSIFSRSENPS